MNIYEANAVVPEGFALVGVYSGVKRSAEKRDLALITCPGGATVAGVYTQNRVCAAPVLLDRARTPSDDLRAVVINSGNANACTGDRGMEDAVKMTRLVGEACQMSDQKVLVLSTGIIGEYLEMEKIAAGIQLATDQLSNTSDALLEAAHGILTTDNGPKIASRRLEIDGASCHLTGIAKGAGMIAPNMATMLAVLMTDAQIDKQLAQELFADTVSRSFNAMSVDGHTSTNDTALLMASGVSNLQIGEAHREHFSKAMDEVAIELAQAIASDGEGASHLIEISVAGCRNDGDAEVIARAIAHSPLVKTAVAGEDPNWGRIVSAAGYAGPDFDPQGVSLKLNDHLIFDRGQPSAFDATAVSESMAAAQKTRIEITFQEGEGQFCFWTSDLTHEYVRINSEYHT